MLTVRLYEYIIYLVLAEVWECGMLPKLRA